MVSCILQGSAWCAYCESAETTAMPAGEVMTDPVVFADESNIDRVQYIRYPFLDTMNVAFKWGFPYSDRFFDIPSSEFSITTAQGSLGLALSAFRSTAGTVEPQYETYLSHAGFNNLRSFGYDEPTSENSLSGIIGMKNVEETTVIAVVTCGQGYQNEWAGNLRVGTGERHEGFSKAAGLLENYLEDYIKDNEITGSRKLWICGISRAGSVGNLVAADAIESGEYDDVYAYLFGVPRTTKAPVAYRGIYNICGQYDPVASVPLESWGYGRYGTDLYTPAQEADADFSDLAEASDKITKSLDGKALRNNPELNYQFRLIEEFLGTFFEDSDEYAARFQDILINAMNHHNNKTEFLSILSDAFNELKPGDEQEKVRIRLVLNYLSFMAGQHLRAHQRQISEGHWDPDEPLEANLVLEHRPATYVKWLFSSADPEKILTSSSVSRRFVVVGNVGVEVRGRSVRNTGGNRGVFMMRNGKETVVSLPDDGEYSVIISAAGSEVISYYEVPVSPDKLLQGDVIIRSGQLRKGSIRMDSLLGMKLTAPQILRGSYTNLGSTIYRYDPTVIMDEELDATKVSYLSLSEAVRFIGKTILALIILLAICLVVFIYHRIMVRKGHPPYSDWYVIIPHLILIAGFACLTVYSYVMLFYIPLIRSYTAAATVVMVFLLTMRGVIRSRERVDMIAAAVILMLSYPMWLCFNRITLDQFSWLKAASFVVVIIAMTAVAVWTFAKSSDHPIIIKKSN